MKQTKRFLRIGIPVLVALATIAQFPENRVAVGTNGYNNGDNASVNLSSASGAGLLLAGALYNFRPRRNPSTKEETIASPNRFLELLKVAQLTSSLDGNTIFAPNDIAMERIQSTLLSPASNTRLTDFLKGHIVKGQVSLESLRKANGTQILPTLRENGSLTLAIGPGDILTVNGYSLRRQKPVRYQGAYLYTIDVILAPQAQSPLLLPNASQSTQLTDAYQIVHP
jgi:uncharacterized surface protein with fasciclin (FAS1) repeats